MNLRSILLASRDLFETAKEAGAVAFFNGEGDYAHRTYMGMVCPCGCARRDILPVHEGADVGRGWGWNGDRVNPTLTPSINLLEGPQAETSHWHGFLTNGEWRPA